MLAVMVYHGHASWLPGGLVGVDIFFVISGYLISRHIAQSAAAGTFSLAEFYRRRVRRIAPALLVVIAAVLLVAAFFMTPEDIESVAKSAVWSLASLANVFFWRELSSSYFAPSSSEVPLLHLWSLGVEEQFYLLWPLVLAAGVARLRGSSVLAGIAVLAAISFVAAELVLPRDAMFAYYMLPTRAGELLVGAFVGVASAQGLLQPSRAQARAASLTGLVLVVGTLALLDPHAPFPGWRAIAPTFGAALIILAGEGRTAAPLPGLDAAPVVFIGRISYSAYLWHWPLFAFFRYGYGEPGVPALLAILGGTLLLAWLSYRFVETPARASQAPVRTVVLQQFALPGAALGALALVLVYGPRLGLPTAPPSYLKALAAAREASKPAYGFDWICQRQRLREADLQVPTCELGPASAAVRNVLVWGDSNAAHYVPMVGEFAQVANFRFRNVETGSCVPLFSDPLPYVEPGRLLDCRASNQVVRAALPRFGKVVIAANWAVYAGRSPTLYDDLHKTISALIADGHPVVLLGVAPRLPGFDRRCREKALRVPGKVCAPLNDPLDPVIVEVNARLKTLPERLPGLQYFDANEWLCPQGRCPDRLPDGSPAYFDPSHLTVGGSKAAGQAVLRSMGVPAAFRPE